MITRQLLRQSIKRNYSVKTERAIVLNQQQLQTFDLDLEGDFPVQEISIDSEPVVRGSEEASFGRKRIGCVELPRSLIQGVDQIIEHYPDKRLIRTDSLRLFDALRSTSGRQPQNEKEAVEPHKLTYGPRESVAYTASVMSGNYAAIYNVLKELKSRVSSFSPNSMLDFGTGPGTAIWAAKQLFDVEAYTAVDLSEDMLNVAEQLEKSVKTDKCQSIEFKRYLSYNPTAPKTDLVISAFTLGDITSEALQKSTVEQLWSQTGDILVLMDRGTPVGFQNIAKARQWILNEQDAHVIAPCSHDKPCPMLFSAESKPNQMWCHYSQRVQRPSFLMKTKHAKNNIEDIKYSYVILRKGKRPSPQSDMETQAYDWPRLVQPPLKKNKHVVLDTCSKEGEIQRMVIPKSQGKVPYRDARKAAWGDLFPHGSKNKVVTRLSKGVVEQD
ncbi:hypothetical protein RMCBS344292_18078 [Rhizopus microsporus]|nr:hypothetical protein RMCBS344292_18078 [Rhizopus microsporus]